jgi:hypothetical protein
MAARGAPDASDRRAIDAPTGTEPRTHARVTKENP